MLTAVSFEIHRRKLKVFIVHLPSPHMALDVSGAADGGVPRCLSLFT